MAVGALHHVVIDGPDPRVLAAFYSELVGLPITYDSDDWVGHRGVRAALRNGLTSWHSDHQPPTWPQSGTPQQYHADVLVDDLDIAEAAALALGATRLQHAGPGRVYADPAGHPFCLIPRPSWVPPVGDAAVPD